MQKNLMKKNIFKKTTLITLFSLTLKIYDKKTLFVVVFDLWNVNKIFCFPNNELEQSSAAIKKWDLDSGLSCYRD